MAVGKGKFLLYSKIDPPLTAGTYRFAADQVLASEDLDSNDLQVERLETHVRVRSPMFVLPPDQVLSTFPPAGREGSFGSRLPQIVMKRRTLPWERNVDPVDAGAVDPEVRLDDVPWLALVVIAEGEAELRQNQPVAECVTPGVTIPGLADSETGNALHIRKSMVDRVFPTQQEVHCLAHAREVDITDTELMMGDDDGFLSVVIANRLPLPGQDDEGHDVPVKYLACLVNLCGQFTRLLPKAPEPPADVLVTTFPLVRYSEISLAARDHVAMGTVGTSAFGPIPKAGLDGTVVTKLVVNPAARAAYEAQPGWGAGERVRGTSDVYAELARDFSRDHLNVEGIPTVLLDPTLRFPVLLHWSFTSTGEQTFQTLMQGLDSGMLATRGSPDPDRPTKNREPSTGRLPLEVVETGHVGLAHRLRHGDEVRSWYRGPLLPHPADEGAERLPLAHAADQVRVVVPDGREDVTLAAAFEIGRLLGLSRPSMVACLMRWRQLKFQRARLGGVVGAGILQRLETIGDLDRFLGGRLGATVAQAMITRPDAVLGAPAPLVTAGRPVLDGVAANAVLADGLGFDRPALEGEPLAVLRNLRDALPRRPRTDVFGTPAEVVRALTPALDTRFSRASVGALASSIDAGVLDRGEITGVPLDLGLAFGHVTLDPALLAGVTLDPASAPPGLFPHALGGDALDGLIEAQRGRAQDAEEDEFS